MNKKASLDDLPIILIIIFFLAVTTLTAKLMLSKVNEQYQESDQVGTTAKDIIGKADNDYASIFDGTFLVIFFVLALGSILMASQVDVSPIFFPASIIVYVILIIVSAVFGNAYYNIASASEMIPYSEQFTIIPFIFNNIVLILLGIGILLGIVLYSKTAG